MFASLAAGRPAEDVLVETVSLERRRGRGRRLELNLGAQRRRGTDGGRARRLGQRRVGADGRRESGRALVGQG